MELGKNGFKLSEGKGRTAREMGKEASIRKKQKQKQTKKQKNKTSAARRARIGAPIIYQRQKKNETKKTKTRKSNDKKNP